MTLILDIIMLFILQEASHNLYLMGFSSEKLLNTVDLTYLCVPYPQVSHLHI